MKNKTELDIIREKFTESGVNAPENMGGDFALELIKDIEPKKTASEKRTQRRGLSFAAAIALFTVGAFALSSVIGNAPKPIVETQEIGKGLDIVSFKNKAEVKKAIEKIEEDYPSGGEDSDYAEDYGSASGSSNIINYSSNYLSDSAVATQKIASSHNATYVQEIGVDEADCIKTDGKHIFCLNDMGYIDIYSAEGKKSKKVGVIKYGKSDDDSDYISDYLNDFYLKDDRLIAVFSRNEHKKYKDRIHSDNYSYRFLQSTYAAVYDISDVKNPKRLDSFSQSGSPCSSRMIGDTLYLISTHYGSSAQEDVIPRTCYSEKGATSDEATPNELPASEIFSVKEPKNTNFVVVSSIDTKSSAQATNTKAILGSADDVYCNTDYLYVTSGVSKNYTVSGEMYALADVGWLRADETEILKIDLNDNLRFTATGKVKGYVNNQYALDEHGSYLRVATTTFTSSTDDEVKEENHLFVLNNNLEQVGAVSGFAEGESIKAVRYIDDTAYVITYEQTDPLFTIDLKNPEKPKILGEVKISGFSTMLVPIDDNTLLGLGYHTQDEDDDIDMEIQEGLKLVVFDVRDKAHPKVSDEKIFKDYESPVQYNPKALVVNFERGDFAIPMTKYDYNNYTDEDNNKAGALNFKVENGKIKIIDNYVSKKLGKSGEASRCVYVGDYIYLIGETYDGDYGDYSDVIDCVKYKD